MRMTPLNEMNIQPPTIHDIDRAVLRRAAWEVIGIFGLYAIAWGTWIRLFGLSIDAVVNGAGIALVLAVGVLSLSFILKEPAIERVAKAAVVAWRARRDSRTAAAQSPEPTPELKTASTNQANADYHLALKILDATFREKSKEKDGETLKGRPWTYRRCHAAQLVNRWEDWSRVMSLWERAGVVTHREGELRVQSLEQGRERLRAVMVGDGYWLVNGVWMKR